MLEGQGLGGTQVVTVTEQPLVEGRLPVEAVAPLRAWLDRLGTDRELRAAAIRRSLQGSLGDLAHRTGAVATALESQAAAVEQLRGDVRVSYDEAFEQVRSDIDQGALLRGEKI